MRYLILCFFSCMLLFSCGDGYKSNASTKGTTATAKQVKAKKPVKNKGNAVNADTRYWNYVKKKMGLTNPQIKKIKKVNQKYSKEISLLKKKKKWKGDAKKAVLDKKNGDLKKVLGALFNKWETTNTRWVEQNEKK